jgi:hypothetical protein
MFSQRDLSKGEEGISHGDLISPKEKEEATKIFGTRIDLGSNRKV